MKTKDKRVELCYDEEADILEVFIGRPRASYFDEIEDDLFEGHDEKTHALTGYKIMNFLARGGFASVRLPMNLVTASINRSQNRSRQKAVDAEKRITS